jgi:hypothetical protein
MDKFWDWMIEKEYCVAFDLRRPKARYIISDENKEDTLPTTQMLIGYMMEYLLSKGFKYNEMIPQTVQCFSFTDVEGMCSWLIETVKKVRDK